MLFRSRRVLFRSRVNTKTSASGSGSRAPHRRQRTQAYKTWDPSRGIPCATLTPTQRQQHKILGSHGSAHVTALGSRRQQRTTCGIPWLSACDRYGIPDMGPHLASRHFAKSLILSRLHTCSNQCKNLYTLSVNSNIQCRHRRP